MLLLMSIPYSEPRHHLNSPFSVSSAVHQNGHDPSGANSHFSNGREDNHNRPRVPLIVLAQQGHNGLEAELGEDGSHGGDMESVGDGMGVIPRDFRLSTISEHTELTELSRRWTSSRRVGAMGPTASLTSNTTSSYGQVIGESVAMS